LEIGVRLLDEQGYQIDSVVKTFESSGIIRGRALTILQELQFSFGQVDLAYAKRFEVKLREFVDDDKPDVQVGNKSDNQSRLDAAKWTEGKAMMGTIAGAIRAWIAQNQIDGSWTQDTLTYKKLGLLASDFDANYFSHKNFSWNVSYNKSAGKFTFTVTATPGKGITSPASITLDHKGQWTENSTKPAKNPAGSIEAGKHDENLAIFESYFPDNLQAGKQLNEYWENRKYSNISDAEFFELFRKGLRACTIQYRGNAPMQHIGGNYIWNKEPFDPRAVDIVYHASFSPEFKYYAVYSGLSVANPKSEKVLKRLVDIAMEPHQLGRIIWGVKQSKQEDEFIAFLEPYLQASDSEKRQHADVVAKAFRGEIDAGKWEKEWNQMQQTEKTIRQFCERSQS